MDSHTLIQALIYLGSAALIVPIAVRLGLGSVLGYLIAGCIIGPWGLRLVTDAESILHFAEIGVVLMLFIIGLELDPQRLWKLRAAVFGGGALGGVHGDRISVVDVSAQVVVAEDGSGLIPDAYREQSVDLGVDAGDFPALPVAHRGPGGRLAAALRVDADGGVVAAGDDDVADSDAVPPRPGHGGGVVAEQVAVDALVEGVGDFPAVSDQQAVGVVCVVGGPGGECIVGHGYRVTGVQALLIAVPVDGVSQARWCAVVDGQ